MKGAPFGSRHRVQVVQAPKTEFEAVFQSAFSALDDKRTKRTTQLLVSRKCSNQARRMYLSIAASFELDLRIMAWERERLGFVMTLR
jgi:hypothetical protein